MELQIVQTVRRYLKMSKREKWLLTYCNLWMTPVVYALLSLLLFFSTAWADLWVTFGSVVPPIFNSNYQLTRTILSTMTASLLSLTSFTFYGVLTALTTFSSQFSPRILKNFMMTKKTQHTLGIFIGSSLYVLLCLLFLNKASHYFFIPSSATFLAVLSLGAFVIFINHIITWLQITNMTMDMKNESIDIIDHSLINELDPYRVKETNLVKDQIPSTKGNQFSVNSSGYLQTIDFISLIREAQKDNIVIRVEYKVGNFVFSSTPLITYWENGKADAVIDEEKYKNMFHLGKKQTEIQDIEYSLNKFVEIAIRALGNHDPKTASDTIYQLGDLLINISKNARFTPYLVDDQQNLLIILRSLDFNDYLYISFASICHYSRRNIVITIELLKVLNAIAQAVRESEYDSVWDFVVYTVKGFEKDYLQSLDLGQFYQILWEIASTTGKELNYYELTDELLQIPDKDDLDEAEKVV